MTIYRRSTDLVYRVKYLLYSALAIAFRLTGLFEIVNEMETNVWLLKTAKLQIYIILWTVGVTALTPATWQLFRRFCHSWKHHKAVRHQSNSCDMQAIWTVGLERRTNPALRGWER